jgi:hypothetical protein
MTTRTEERVQQLDAAWNALTDDLQAAMNSAQLIRNKAMNALRERENLKDDQIDRIKRIEQQSAATERAIRLATELHHDC